MRYKPKTVRRLLLVGGVALALVAGAFALIVVRQWQTERLMQALRAEGVAALEAGDPYLALNKLAPYVRRHYGDAESVKAYAEARAAIEEADGSHLMQAITHYRNYLDLRPDDREAQVRLLGWFNQVRHFPEARDLAARLRPEDLGRAGPEHARVLREEAIALLGLRVEDERLEAVSRRLAEVAPDDLDAQMIRMEVIAKREGPDATRAYGEALRTEAPDDPRRLLLAALGRLAEPTAADLREVRALLCRAAGLEEETARRTGPTPLKDAAFVRVLVEAFDRVHLHGHALAVLEDAAEGSGDVALRRLLVRRLWQDGRLEEVERRTAGLDPAVRSSDAELLGFRALALAAMGRGDEAREIAAAITGRGGDFRADGWARVIPLRDPAEAPAPLDLLAGLRAAIDLHPLEPVFLAFRGDALASLQRTQEACEAWRAALKSPLATGWALPHVRLAETLLADGRVREAAESATAALLAAPGNVVVNTLWFEAQAARLERRIEGGPGAAAVLARLEEARQRLGRHGAGAPARPYEERLMAIHAALLGAAGRLDAAREVVEQALAEPALSEGTLERLAAVSARHGLGLEGACVERAAALHPESLGVAVMRATALAREGRADEGRRLVEQAAARRPEGSVEGGLALARYLEAIGDPEAAAAWASLGDAHPHDARVQRLCLDSSAAARDAAFIGRTVERFRRLTGRESEPDGVRVKVARARALLASDPTPKQRDDAVALLSAAVTEAPTLLEPKLLLAAALRLDDPERGLRPDLPGAIAQLRSAAVVEPGAPAITLELARALQAAREFRQAREHLLRVAMSPTAPAGDRRTAAELLVAQGDDAEAVPALLRLVDEAGAGADPSLMGTLAAAYRRLRQDERAAALYERMIEAAPDDAEVALTAATFFASRGERARAESILAGLDRGAPGSEAALARARFAAALGDAERALELFERAVEDDPADAEAWVRYADFLAQRGEHGAAGAVAERARRALPGEPRIAVLHERTRVAASARGDEDLGPLINAMAEDAASSPLRSLVRAIESERAAGRLRDVEALLGLAERFPSSLALQLFVARRLAALDPPELERAYAVAERAMQAFPTRPEPARLAAELAGALGRWNDVLRAAGEWRGRDLGRPVDADLAVAHALLALGQHEPALAALEPRLAAALESPDDPASAAVLGVRARLLVLSGRVARAREMLEPLLERSPAVRAQVWLDVAAKHVPAEQALAWVERVRPLVDPESVDEQLALAAALSTLATRLPEREEAMLHEAHEVLRRLAAGAGQQSPVVFEALGITRHRQGDVTGAAEAYRRAIDLDGTRAVALNNLATILMEGDADLEGALGLARRAVELGGPHLASHLDTLASVHRRIGQRRAEAGDSRGATEAYLAAAEAYRGVAERRGGDVEALLAWAETSGLAGRHEMQARAYEQLLAAGSLPEDVAAGARNNLACALLRLGRGPEDAERARTLVVAALDSREAPEFRDTLGWAEWCAGRASAAEEAFRRALEARPDLASSMVGLALVLAQGSAEQRREAAEWARRARERAAGLDAWLAGQLEAAGAALRRAG